MKSRNCIVPDCLHTSRATSGRCMAHRHSDGRPAAPMPASSCGAWNRQKRLAQTDTLPQVHHSPVETRKPVQAVPVWPGAKTPFTPHPVRMGDSATWPAWVETIAVPVGVAGCLILTAALLLGVK